MFYEIGVVGEVISLSVFKNKHSVVCQNVAVEDETRQCWQCWKVVGRVCEDDVEALMTRFYEFQNVAANEQMVLCANLFHALSDECGVLFVLLNAHYLLATTR